MTLKNKNFKFLLLISIWLFVNALFILKYGSRQNLVPTVWVMVFYSIFSTILLFLIVKGKKHKRLFNKLSKWGLFVGIGIIAIAMTMLVNSIESRSINVDRWSALEISVECLTQGLYPYTRSDHLGGMSSNLPGLAFLALPFYLLGDVGYLQVATVIFFSSYLFWRSRSVSTSSLIIILFISSPAVLWEIVVKSDFLTNILLCFMCIDFWNTKNPSQKLKQPFVLGAMIGFFLLTRGVLIIPLTIFFFLVIWQSSIKNKLKFLLSFLMTVVLICTPTFLSAPNLDTLISYNPFGRQTNKAPLSLYLLLPLILFIPWVCRTYRTRLYGAALVLFGFPLLALLIRTYDLGWYNAIVKYNFNFSYLNVSIPPILFWLIIKSKNQITE